MATGGGLADSRFYVAFSFDLKSVSLIVVKRIMGAVTACVLSLSVNDFGALP